MPNYCLIFKNLFLFMYKKFLCIPHVFSVAVFFLIVFSINFEIGAPSQQTHQRWINVDHQRSSKLFQRWYLVENESWTNVHLSTLFQRWQNNVEAMSIELCWFNVDEPMLFQRWNFVEIKSQADVCLSIKCRWPNVVLTLIFGWKWKLNQRIFIGVASKLRKQHSKNFVNCCTDLYWCSLESDSKTKQN